MKQPESEPEPEPDNEPEEIESDGELKIIEPEEQEITEHTPEPAKSLPDPIVIPETQDLEPENNPNPAAAGGKSFEMFKFFTCRVCKHLFNTPTDMWEHMAEEHKELRKFKCTMCNFKAVCRERLFHHKVSRRGHFMAF